MTKQEKMQKIIALEEKVFSGQDFEPAVFNDRKCYKGKDGFYYRLDHFSGTYVIEYADNTQYAESNWFDDADRFDDGIREDELIKQLREALKEYVAQA